MSALTLYEVEDELQAYLDTEDGVPEEQQEEFQAALSAKGVAALDRRDAVIRAFQAVEANIEAVKAEKRRLTERQTRLENGLKRFRQYLASVLQSLPQPAKGARKLEGRIGTISLRKGSESVEIVDASRLPLTACSVTVTMSGVTWDLLKQIVSDPAVGTALAAITPEITPDKAKLKAEILRLQAQEEAASFELEVAEEETEKQAIRLQITHAITEQIGARVVIGPATTAVV